MAAEPQTQHECEWKEAAERLQGELARVQGEQESLKAQLAALQRAVFGKKSEKLPPVQQELRQQGQGPSREDTLKLREERRARRAELPEREVLHRVPAAERRCPKCGSTDLRPLGEGRRTVVYEYVPARFEKQVHVQETLSCRCGECVLVAPGPARVVDKGQYGPGFMAHVVTAKCCDSIPLYRQAKAYLREGIPVARTTLCDLFHAAAGLLEPLARRLLELIAAEALVLADETPLRIQARGKTRRGYLWTFRTGKLVAYCFSPSRSGETPLGVLGGTQGYLVVDGYTGYNRVVVPEGRVRVACWAHVRRRFFEALPTAPEAKEMMELILELYRVEHAVQLAGLTGTQEHLRRRQTLSAPLLARIRAWMKQEAPKHLPKGPLGEAISYAQGQWEALERFLEDARLPLDNNASERALRVAALGRKNFLFVGHDAAGEDLAALYSLVATCEQNGVNPEAYLADVLLRVQTHPASRIDELLPHRWRPAPADSS